MHALTDNIQFFVWQGSQNLCPTMKLYICTYIVTPSDLHYDVKPLAWTASMWQRPDSVNHSKLVLSLWNWQLRKLGSAILETNSVVILEIISKGFIRTYILGNNCPYGPPLYLRNHLWSAISDIISEMISEIISKWCLKLHFEVQFQISFRRWFHNISLLCYIYVRHFTLKKLDILT